MEPEAKRQKTETPLYVAMHKPIGYVSSTVSQKKGMRTIYELLEEKNFPKMGLCGRLDAQTSGIMLFTNDSAMLQALLLPEEQEGEDTTSADGTGDKVAKECVTSIKEDDKNYKWKEYHLTVLASPDRKWGTGVWSEAEKLLIEEMSAPIEFVTKGVRYRTNPAEVKVLSRFRSEKHAHDSRGPRGQDLGWCVVLSIILREGKHHQIRRLASRSKLRVMSLKRHSFAGGLLTADDPTLKEPGGARHLTEEEIAELRARTKLV